MAEIFLIFITAGCVVELMLLMLFQSRRKLIPFLLSLAFAWLLFGDLFFFLTGKADFVVWPLRPGVFRTLCFVAFGFCLWRERKNNKRAPLRGR